MSKFRIVVESREVEEIDFPGNGSLGDHAVVDKLGVLVLSEKRIDDDPWKKRREKAMFAKGWVLIEEVSLDDEDVT